MTYNIELSLEQQKVLTFIRSYIVEHGDEPSLSIIKEEFGYSYKSAAQHHVKALKQKGLLDVPRSNSKQLTDIPLVGAVSCGPAILAEENINAYIPYDKSKLKRKDATYFFLQATGDSMNLAKPIPIEDGDFVLVRQDQTANDYQNIIALIGDDATCKRLEHTKEGYPALVPMTTNTATHKKRIMLESFNVLGIVEDVVKKRRIE